MAFIARIRYSEVFQCKDVEFPGTDPSTSTHCVGGIVDGDAGKPTNGDDRKLLSSNESITISDDNTSKTVASQCAIGRMGPLCNKCGPFGEYIEMQHPEREGRTYCASCEELTGQGYDYEALTTSLGMFLLVAFYGFNVFNLTRSGMLFQMLDADDSGSVEVDEYLEAVREYAGYTKDQISDKELHVIFKAFDVDGDGEVREKFSWHCGHTLERIRNPRGAEKSLALDVHKIVEDINKKEKDLRKIKAPGYMYALWEI